MDNSAKIPDINEEVIFAQNELTPFLNRKMPEVIIGNYSVTLLEMHWVAVSLHRSFHSHRFYEIHIPYQGQGKVFTKTSQAFFKPGHFTINIPEVAHSWECLYPPLNMQVWWITVRKLNEKTEKTTSSTEQIISNLLSATGLTYPLDPVFYQLYDQMITEIAKDQVGMEIVLKSLFIQFLIILGRAVKPIQAKPQIKEKAKTPRLTGRMLLSRVDEYISGNLAHEITLDDIAQHLSMSTRTLTRRYHKNKGQTIWQTITEMRMIKASVLLLESDLSVMEIAERSGIHDKHYFSTKFSSYFGASPRKYRLQNVKPKY